MSKVIIISAPSGSGKSTLIAHLMEQGLNLHFSVSATSRQPRGQEQHGVDYFFLSPEEFKERIEKGEFLEYCEVYENRFYGTLASQVDDQLAKGENVVCDVDVEGALNIKKCYGPRALSVFVCPPSIDALRERLNARGTDAPSVIEDRIARASYELSFAGKFDKTVVNDNLDKAKAEITAVIRDFLQTQ